PTGGVIADLGCGPGHVSRYLKDRGASVVGVDLSPKMVEKARALNPDIEFHRGNIFDLRPWKESWTGIVAFYSIVNSDRKDLPRAFAEMYRSLQSGGRLLLSFHIGDETLHLDEWWDQKVNVNFFFFPIGEIARLLKEAGFELEGAAERNPYREVEHPSRR